MPTCDYTYPLRVGRKRRLAQRATSPTAKRIDLNDRSPEAQVVPGLKRKDAQRFIDHAMEVMTFYNLAEGQLARYRGLKEARKHLAEHEEAGRR